MVLLRRPMELLWRHRRLLWQTTKTDIRARYAGSVLGLSWLVLYPLCFLGVYALFCIYILKVKLELIDARALSPGQYVAMIFCGLIPFIGFTEALAAGIPSVTSNAKLIKNTLFPIDLIPVKAVLASVCTQATGLGLLVLALAALGKLTPWALLLPVVFVAQLALSIGLIWVLSAINVYVRDLQNVVAVLSMMLMLATPIAYTREMIPAALHPFLAINPLYYIVISYQEILMWGRWPGGHALEVLLGLAAFFLVFGYWFFSRMKCAFADDV